MMKYFKSLTVAVAILLTPAIASAQAYVRLWPGLKIGTIDAADETVVSPPVRGAGGATVQVVGSFTGSLSVACTTDGTNYGGALTLTQLDDQSTTATAITSAGIYTTSITGCDLVKVTADSFDSGSVVITITTTQSGSSSGSVSLAGIELNGGRIPVLADINNTSSVDDANRAEVVGGLARDENVDDLQPLLAGCRASTAVPTAMSADADLVDIRCNRNGAVFITSTYSTSTVTSVNDSATNVTGVATNTARMSLKCTNTSTAIAYVKEGATATTASFTVIINPGQFYNWPLPVPTSIIDVIWATDPNAGALVCTEGTQ